LQHVGGGVIVSPPTVWKEPVAIGRKSIAQPPSLGLARGTLRRAAGFFNLTTKEETMPINVKGKPYLQVVERLNKFRKEFTIADEWAVTTEVIHCDEKSCAVKASIVSPGGVVVATGTAEEQRDDGPVNKTSAIENCETSAVGRALSFAGYPGSEIASAEEVLRAIDQQSKLPQRQAQAPVEEIDDWRGVEIHFGKNKGKQLRELSDKQLSWYQTKWDPKKDKDGNEHNHPVSAQDALLRQALDDSINEEHETAQSMSDEVPF
jgi:hypothetical protein